MDSGTGAGFGGRERYGLPLYALRHFSRIVRLYLYVAGKRFCQPTIFIIVETMPLDDHFIGALDAAHILGRPRQILTKMIRNSEKFRELIGAERDTSSPSEGWRIDRRKLADVNIYEWSVMGKWLGPHAAVSGEKKAVRQTVRAKWVVPPDRMLYADLRVEAGMTKVQGKQWIRGAFPSSLLKYEYEPITRMATVDRKVAEILIQSGDVKAAVALAAKGIAPEILLAALKLSDRAEMGS
jgi:hypothetical protein